MKLTCSDLIIKIVTNV